MFRLAKMIILWLFQFKAWSPFESLRKKIRLNSLKHAIEFNSYLMKFSYALFGLFESGVGRALSRTKLIDFKAVW